MKENKGVIWLFITMFGCVLIFLASSEQLHTSAGLPSTRINYSADTKRGINTSALFDKSAIIKFSSTMFDREDSTIAEDMTDSESFARSPGFVISDEELMDSTVDEYYSILDLYNGYIKYNDLIEGLNMLGIERNSDTHQFEQFVDLVPSGQSQLSLLELGVYKTMLDGVFFIGSFDAYRINAENSYIILRTAKVFYNKDKNYRIILDRDLDGTDYLFVDRGADMSIEYGYTFTDNQLENRTSITSEDLDQVVYTSFLDMIISNEKIAYIPYKKDPLMLIRHIY